MSILTLLADHKDPHDVSVACSTLYGGMLHEQSKLFASYYMYNHIIQEL